MDIENIDGFDWDAGNLAKCGKHGVSRSEIEHALATDPDVSHDKTGSLEERFNAVGMTQDARAVFIVFTIRTRGGSRFIRPISARYMHERERNTYERTKGP